MHDPDILVITIDGPTASGKGTVAQKVAQKLGLHYLDSGALYRLIALLSIREDIPIENEKKLTKAAENLSCYFSDGQTFLMNENVSNDIRSEAVGHLASKIAEIISVRQALFKIQLNFQQHYGLVADGRDMGTVIFPHASLKVFLTASTEIRSKRRYKQLIEKGFTVSMKEVENGLAERDKRDTNRTSSPLKAAVDAFLLDTSEITVDQAVAKIISWAYR